MGVGDSNSDIKSAMFSRDGSRDSSPSCEATTAIISLSAMSGVRSDCGGE